MYIQNSRAWSITEQDKRYKNHILSNNKQCYIDHIVLSQIHQNDPQVSKNSMYSPETAQVSSWHIRKRLVEMMRDLCVWSTIRTGS